MNTIFIVLLLMLAVVASDFISRLLPLMVPRPLVQMAIGGLIGLAPQLSVQLDPEVFFLLFVPPLLFLDGWRIPNEDLLKDRKAILQLALGLVALTVVGIGWFVHWMIPSMPLAVAFALAAVVSPTDPIAINSLAGRINVPQRLMRILAGESLLNDASGLVCLRFAIIAALSGSFSVYAATLSFIWLAAGGIAVGVLSSFCIARSINWLTRQVGEESGAQIMVSLLIPFAAYILAETWHCSGILAAVSAGVTLSYLESAATALPVTRMQRHFVWDTIHFAANGMIFVLLGEQLPTILNAADQALYSANQHHAWWLMLYVLAINAGLILLRFLWVWVSLNVIVAKAYLSGADARRPNWRLIAASSLAGVRGAITLAGVMTLPFTLHDGTPFPARELAIVLAMGVIIVSLLVASIGLPILLRDVQSMDSAVARDEEDRARIVAAKAAIDAINRVHREQGGDRQQAQKYALAASLITNLYRSRIASKSLRGPAAEASRDKEAVDKALRVAAIKAEREAIFELLRTQQIGSETATKLVRELDLLETRHEG